MDIAEGASTLFFDYLASPAIINDALACVATTDTLSMLSVFRHPARFLAHVHFALTRRALSRAVLCVVSSALVATGSTFLVEGTLNAIDHDVLQEHLISTFVIMRWLRAVTGVAPMVWKRVFGLSGSARNGEEGYGDVIQCTRQRYMNEFGVVRGVVGVHLPHHIATLMTQQLHWLQMVLENRRAEKRTSLWRTLKPYFAALSTSIAEVVLSDVTRCLGYACGRAIGRWRRRPESTAFALAFWVEHAVLTMAAPFLEAAAHAVGSRVYRELDRIFPPTANDAAADADEEQRDHDEEHDARETFFSTTALRGKRDLYEVLGVSNDATPEDIKRAYRKLALEHHPDRVGSLPPEERESAAAAMASINDAYDVLSDESKKRQYDQARFAMDPSSSIVPTVFMQRLRRLPLPLQAGVGVGALLGITMISGEVIYRHVFSLLREQTSLGRAPVHSAVGIR